MRGGDENERERRQTSPSTCWIDVTDSLWRSSWNAQGYENPAGARSRERPSCAPTNLQRADPATRRESCSDARDPKTNKKGGEESVRPIPDRRAQTRLSCDGVRATWSITDARRGLIVQRHPFRTTRKAAHNPKRVRSALGCVCERGWRVASSASIFAIIAGRRQTTMDTSHVRWSRQIDD